MNIKIFLSVSVFILMGALTLSQLNGNIASATDGPITGPISGPRISPTPKPEPRPITAPVLIIRDNN